MHNRLLIIISIIVVITGCKQQDNKSSSNQNDSISLSNELDSSDDILDSGFNSYLNKISAITLPYETTCGKFNPDSPIDDMDLIQKYSEGGFEPPYRRISTENDFEIVLCYGIGDNLIPIIRTYDKDGKILSSQQIFFGYCGGEPGFYQSEFLKINPDLSITHIDSTWTYEIDSLDNNIPETENLEVVITEYKIQNNGNITKK
jgi:hypothetical protein